MVGSIEAPQDRPRRLTVDFAAWLDEPPAPEADFYQRGLVVLDTNVLLDLYRVKPDTRIQVTKALSAVGDRLWVPHQAAIEFSRNRKQVVIDRLSSFKRVREALRSAAANAIDVIDSALHDFERLRLRNGESRVWDSDAKGLGHGSLEQRLRGVMDPALAELEAMLNEHDLQPGDMQSTDAVLKQVDQLLAGRIGPSYDSSRLRDLVEEAINHRYPNEIPPGYLDSRKEVGYRAAGDFVL